MKPVQLFEQWNAVNEIGDASVKPFPWKADGNIKRDMKDLGDAVQELQSDEFKKERFKYYFTSDSDTEYIVEFGGWMQRLTPIAFGGSKLSPSQLYDSKFNLAFNTFSDHFAGIERETNKGEMFGIMSTVTEIAFDFLQEAEKSGYPVKTLTILGKGDGDDKGGIDTRRGRIYLAYIKKQMRKLKTKSKYSALLQDNKVYILLGDWKGGNVLKTEKVDLDRVEKYADDILDPVDVEFTKHFFDRLTRAEHDKEITDAELIGFFKRLAKKQKQFDKFMKQYDEFVIKDNRTDINIPFKAKVDQIIAKTIMRKGDFKTSDPEYKI